MNGNDLVDRVILEEWDKEYIWHPFTQMQEYIGEDSPIIAKGDGVYLYDVDGTRYLDGVSSLWVTVHGHRHPVLNQAIKDQLDQIAHSTLLGLSNVPSVLLAKKLVDITPPGLCKVFYSDNGSTAVEVAVKMAYHYWQLQGATGKTKFVKLEEAYHGDTIGSVSVGGIGLFHQIFARLLFPTYTAPAPHCYRCSNGESRKMQCLDAMEEILRNKAGEIAAVIMEPLVQGAAGMIVHPAGFLSKVRELTSQYGVFLILDEVATGFGRTGTMFGCEHEGVSPDFLCLAKGITGGYLPLAATLTTEKIFNQFMGSYGELKAFFHGHTYTGNPLACAAALSNLEIFEREDTLTRLQEKISFLEEMLKKNFAPHPHVGEVRQRGFMVGLELVRNKDGGEPYPLEQRVGHLVIKEARKLGGILRPLGNVIVLMPPLAITLDQLKELLDITYQAIDEVTRDPSVEAHA
jgi:adenosylmethionine-8-amino-7-oxononanoate aminotransferase